MGTNNSAWAVWPSCSRRHCTQSHESNAALLLEVEVEVSKFLPTWNGQSLARQVVADSCPFGTRVASCQQLSLRLADMAREPAKVSAVKLCLQHRSQRSSSFLVLVKGRSAPPHIVFLSSCPGILLSPDLVARVEAHVGCTEPPGGMVSGFRRSSIEHPFPKKAVVHSGSEDSVLCFSTECCAPPVVYRSRPCSVLCSRGGSKEN